MRKRQKKSKRKLFIVVASAILVAIVLGIVGILLYDVPFSNPFRPKETPATISDKEVNRLKAKTPELFKGEYATVAENDLRARIQSDKEDRILLVKEAKRRGIDNVAKQLNTSLDAIRANYGSNEDYQRYLSDQGVTERELRTELEENIIINDLTKSLVSEKDITDAETRSYYETNKSHYPPDYNAAKQQVIADLLGKKRSEALDKLLKVLKDSN